MLSRPRRTRLVRTASCALSLFVCSACATDDRADAPSSGNPSREVSGVVVDGYLEGATVFLDLNGNHAQDADEPSTTTDAKGAFHLTVHGTAADTFADLYLHASVPSTAKDSDDLGATLQQAGKSAFTLLSPAAAYFAVDAGSAPHVVISPLSALVAGEMIATGRSVAEAKQAVQTRLGLEGKDLLLDFVAAPDMVLHNVARAAAVSLGEAEKTAAATADGGVSRDPGAHVAAALASVQSHLPGVVDALGLREAHEPASLDDLKKEWVRGQDDDDALETDDGGKRGSASAQRDGGSSVGHDSVETPESKPTRAAAGERDAGTLELPEYRLDAGPIKLPEPTRDASLVKPTEPTRDASVVKPTEPTRDAGVVKPTEPARDASAVKPTEPARDAGSSHDQHDGGVATDAKRG
ncbi:MAG: hypothetical protein RLZZ450_3511 [Pseudomonadota bacterium]|jgi:hypothetical protein